MDTTLSLSSFRPAEKRWNWRSLHTLSYLTQRVLCRIGGIRRSPLICGSHVMHWHATSCTGRERARSGMEGQGRSCRRGAIAADGGGFALLTIVIYTLFSVSRIDSHQEDYYLHGWFSSIRLDLYTLCAPGSALSHFVYNFMASGFPRLY